MIKKANSWLRAGKIIVPPSLSFSRKVRKLRQA